MNKTHLRTYANHIRAARLNRAEALQVELAVMFAVIGECNDNQRLAREAIFAAYDTSGSYQCGKPGDRDWISVGRVIRAGIALYFSEHIGPEEVSRWGDGLKYGDLINAYVEHLKPLKLATVNEVLTVCEKVKPAARQRNAPAGSTTFDTEHIHLAIPPNVGADEVMTLVRKLMEYANTLLDASKTRTERKAA